MKNYPVLLLLLCASVTYSQSNVYLCVDETGKKEYKNDKANPDCKKVNLPDIMTIPPSPKKLAPPKKLPIEIGMSKVQVTKKWGKPSKVRRTQTRNGITENWLYSDGKVLTFANGSLEVIQD